MAYWLMKSEPDDYSIDDLKRDKREPWDGIRNYQARNFMRDDMKIGDEVFFYQSNCKEPGIVGLMTIASEAYPDPTQFDKKDKHYDPKSPQDNPRWLLVDVKYKRKLKRNITLAELREQKTLEDMILLLAYGHDRQPVALAKQDHVLKQEALEQGPEPRVKRFLQIFAAAIVVLVGVGVVTTPAKLTYEPPLTTPMLPPPDVAAGIIPETEKRVLRFNDAEKSEWSVVYVHGFSATRQEIAPVAEHVARELNGNLFETRLAGHGISENALYGVTAEAWLDDMAEALAAGAALGEKVVVIATSTGATLTTALHDHPLMQHVDAFVFFAPNYGLPDEGARRATGPAGKLLMRLAAGESYSWEPANEAQGLYWATTYPTSSVIEMLRLMDRVDASLPLESPQRWLVIYSDQDDVVSPQAIRDTLKQVNARDVQTLLVDTSNDTSHHVFTGDIMAPHSTADTVAAIVDFIRRPVP